MRGAGSFELRLEPLGKHHHRATFTCGADSLDSYLRNLASQDMRRRANAVFVLVPTEAPTDVVGYFTLCAYTLEPGTVPEEARMHIPRYPLVSATLIGRLAISTACQGQGIGAMLLVRALRLAYESAAAVGSSMVVVDAIDERAASFYAAHGFIRLPGSMRLVLPMRAVARIVEE
jgi:predicted GNAT family N-acyltransferase